MTYATPATLLERFDAEEIAQRTDRSIPRLVTGNLLALLAAGGDMTAYTAQEQAATAAALAVAQLALQDAYDTINGYLQGRYDVPLASPPDVIALTECNLARYFLYDDNVTEVVKTRYEAGMDFLKSLRDGKVSIGPTNASAGTPPTGTIATNPGTPLFGSDALEFF
jgi:phage gp36-like protein